MRRSAVPLTASGIIVARSPGSLQLKNAKEQNIENE